MRNSLEIVVCIFVRRYSCTQARMTPSDGVRDKLYKIFRGFRLAYSNALINI